MEKPLVLCIGNVLLDILHKCKDDSLLKKYDLNADDSIELAEWQMSLFDDILDGSKSFSSSDCDIKDFQNTDDNAGKHATWSPGGSAQNTARVMQWCLKEVAGNGVVAFTGCVGKDRMAKVLERNLQKDGVDVAYMYHETVKTGACAALITRDNQRSLCANIGASQYFSSLHFSSPELQTIIRKVKIIYCEGFFITHSYDAVTDLLQLSPNKTFVLNLSGVYVCKKYFLSVRSLMPFADIVFCNIDEAIALTEMLEMAEKSRRDAVDVVKFLAHNLPPNCDRTIVVTQGENPVVCHRGNEISSFDVPKLDKIVDTVGAGDAFAAGFLSAHCLGKSLDRAVSCGIYAAQEIIKEKGCSIPNFFPQLGNIPIIPSEYVQ